MVVTSLATNHKKKPETKTQCCEQALPDGTGQKTCLLPIP